MPDPQNNWPPDYRVEYIKRIHLLQGGNDKKLRQALMTHYARNPIDWINDWGITYDPRVKSSSRVMPFMLFPRQVEFINFLQGCVADKECGLVEKSRDVGATWLCCSYSVWLWLFSPGASVGWGSRKELLVDRIGDPDSIFEKMRMILRNTPAWMLPKGFSPNKHAPYMKIINPDTGATITGESGKNIGRGGRSMIYFKDESAHYERPELIEAALGDNTDVQIDVSSVHGSANVFYRRRTTGEVWEPDKVMPKGKTRVFVFDWRDHPGKPQSWYDLRRARAETEGLLHIFAQEVDRDYLASMDKILISPAWVKAAIDAHKKLGFDESGDKVSALDVADEGGDKNALAVRFGVVLKHCDEWAEGDTGTTARRAVSICQKMGVRDFYYDCLGVGAGVKAETNRLRSEGIIKPSMYVQKWNAAASPVNPSSRLVPGDYQSPKNEDYFSNLKAQAYMNLRIRFEKTYKAVTQGVSYPPDELISLDSENLSNIHDIVMQLSQPTHTTNGAGKLVIDKKPDGARSPNLADAVMMCFFAPANISVLDWLGRMQENEADEGNEGSEGGDDDGIW